MATIKIDLPSIKKGTDWRSLRNKLRAQLSELDAWNGVQAAVSDAAEPDDPIWPAGANAAQQTRRVNGYRHAYAAISKAIELGSELDRLVNANQAETLVNVIRILDREYLHLQNIDVNMISNTFNTERWDYKKEPLREWITNKWALLLKLTDEYPNEVSRNVAMCRILCELVGDNFKDITNRYRVNRPNTWRTIEQALKDYECAHPSEKAESQGKVLVAKVEELEKELKEVKASSNFAGGKPWKRHQGGKPWKKHRGGKHGDDVRKDKGHGNKGGGKYGNNKHWKGKQSGKKGVSDMVCYKCGGHGHSSLYCPTGTQVKDLHKYKS